MENLIRIPVEVGLFNEAGELSAADYQRVQTDLCIWPFGTFHFDPPAVFKPETDWGDVQGWLIVSGDQQLQERFIGNCTRHLTPGTSLEWASSISKG